MRMSVIPNDALPEVLSQVRTRPLLVLRLSVKPYQVIGNTPGGYSRIGIVPGGTFEGDRLSGEVMEGGADWQMVRSDGATTLDVRMVLKTDDGATIGMHYRGLRSGPPDVIARLDRAEPVDPASYYFRTSPQFETAADKYSWMNRLLALGIGYRTTTGVIYSVFELL
jgi:hypothetical protein